MIGITVASDGLVFNKTSLAFLPWAHVYGQTCELFLLFSTGSAMAIVPHRDLIVDCIGIVKPEILISVPTLFNKIYDGVMKKVSQGSAVSKFLFNRALKISRKKNHLEEFQKPVPFFLQFQFRFYDSLVFKKLRERLGGRLISMTAGGASTNPIIEAFFQDIGIPILGGYGLTETSPVVSGSSLTWESRRIGTCGVPLQDVSLLFINPETLEEVDSFHSNENKNKDPSSFKKGEGEEGELCVNGPCVMNGYHRNPQATAEVFLMRNGKKYFRTGDLARLVDGRFLKITGRIKEQFKLENGKYVVPIPAEDAICRSVFISQV